MVEIKLRVIVDKSSPRVQQNGVKPGGPGNGGDRS